jgi:hypothetical protein
MTLAFSQTIDNKPSYFIEKIICQLSKQLDEELDEYTLPTRQTLGYTNSLDFIRKVVDVKPKKHTLRRDTANRWKAGTKIHPVIHNRTPNRFQFAPIIPCVSTQKIEIKHFADAIEVVIADEKCFTAHHIGLHKMVEYDFELEVLAKNDGFNSIEDFFKYFKEDFVGKIIHWTNLKY